MPAHGAGHLTKGCVLAQEARYDEALAAFRHAATLNPYLPDLYFFIGQSLVGLGRRAAAVEALETAVATEPNSVKARYRLAVLYGEAGKSARAMELLQVAHDLAPNDQRVLQALERLADLGSKRPPDTDGR